MSALFPDRCPACLSDHPDQRWQVYEVFKGIDTTRYTPGRFRPCFDSWHDAATTEEYRVYHGKVPISMEQWEDEHPNG